jgi:hypothetical protein
MAEMFANPQFMRPPSFWYITHINTTEGKTDQYLWRTLVFKYFFKKQMIYWIIS